MMRCFACCSSLKLTCGALGLLVLCAVGSQLPIPINRDWMLVPLALLAVNLAAALKFSTAIRRSAALVTFHVALLLLCLLAAANTLTEWEGRVELAEGQSFDWRAVQVQRQGLWNSVRRGALTFEQGPLDVRFAPGRIRQETRSQIGLHNDKGGTTTFVVSDLTPLHSDGYRLSSTSNKGFALLLMWEGADGATQTGAVHLPSYPAMEWKQEQAWRTPAGETVSLSLSVPAAAHAAEHWSMRSLLSKVSVQLRTVDGNHALGTGDQVRLVGGSLRLLDVRLWMGYRVDYQPFLPPLLACAFAGIAALGVHVLRRYFPVGAVERTALSSRAHTHHA